MNVESKVAAETAALISFHCVICFDELNLQDRPPMVLPCGHTFVCLPCTKRIRKCMECREPLHVSLSANYNKQVARRPAYTRASRYGTNISPQVPFAPSYPPSSSVHPSPPTLLPLPISKNIVLISMIEAAERQSRRMEELKSKGGSLMEAPNEDRDGEQFDLHKMISGITSLSGSCGTYAVRATSGLTMVSSDPRSSESQEKHKNGEDQAAKNSVALVEGQKLQIVDFEHGVARLARNGGYVKANAAQLVKVGTPLDEACRLEGLLKVIQSRSTDLQKGIEENRKMENHLRRQLEAALEAKETHPVVADSPSPEEYLYEPSKSSSFDSISHTHPTSTDQRITEPVLQTPERSSRARHVFEGCGAANRKEGNSASLSSLSISLDNSDAHRPFPQHRSKGRDGASVPGCGTTLLVDTGYLFYYSGSEDDDNIDTNSNTTRRSGTDIERTPSLLRTPTPTSSFDGINFRTGLSGHRALTIAKTGGQYTPPRGMRLMMSQHRGVTNTRLHRGGPPMPPSLTFTNSPLK